MSDFFTAVIGLTVLAGYIAFYLGIIGVALFGLNYLFG